MPFKKWCKLRKPRLTFGEADGCRSHPLVSRAKHPTIFTINKVTLYF